jgi:hypothetical protein
LRSTTSSTWRDRVYPDPNRPGPDLARLPVHRIAVWTINGYLQAIGHEVTPETIAMTAEADLARMAAMTVALA